MIIIESINHIGITVSNLERSVNFYKEMFDFEVVESAGGADQAFLKMGDILISLSEVSEYKSPAESKNCISFFVDEEDFEDALDELEEKNIKIVHGPENIRNGKSVIFLDPDDNRIEISYPKII